jgi:two-component system sensor histidine kinase YesM
MNLITKMLLLVTLLMSPVIVLFIYSNQQSVQVVTDQIHLSNQGRLERFIHEIEDKLEQISSVSNLITKDPDVTEFAAQSFKDDRYSYLSTLDAIERKLALFSLSTDRMSRINAYFPAVQNAASSHSSQIEYNESYIINHFQPNWSFRSLTDNGTTKRAFTRYFAEPYAGIADIQKASIILEIDVMEDNIIAMLDEFKTKGNNDPFLYHAGARGNETFDERQFIRNSSSNSRMTQLLAQAYEQSIRKSNTERHYDTLQLDGKEYLVYFYNSDNLGWVLFDYVPLQDILAPVTRTEQLFYTTVGVLLLLGCISIILLYMNVQVPIRLLTNSIDSMRQGKFSVRIRNKQNREFTNLMQQFNEMAEQIQHLVEQVYVEEIRTKEATMKQLQSQINPHFLYNSLAYIVSMGKMNRSSAVVSMAYSLADYFKYTARNNLMLTTVREEMDFVISYMDIMNYQLEKVRYVVDIPDSIGGMTIPRLLIQPIVENAIVHGLESKLTEGLIRIIGAEHEGNIMLTVEDDGAGLHPEQLQAQNRRLQSAFIEDRHFGLWNVNQRLRYHYGPEAGVKLYPSELGGLSVVLTWRHPIQDLIQDSTQALTEE